MPNNLIQYELKKKKFSSTYKVYFADTDAAGVVHHSRYVSWLEASRIDFLDHIHYPYSDLQKEKIGFSPIHIDINYHKPLRFGDSFEIRTQVEAFSRTSISFYSEFINQDQVMCSATQKLACLDEINWKLTRISSAFFEKLDAFESTN